MSRYCLLKYVSTLLFFLLVWIRFRQLLWLAFIIGAWPPLPGWRLLRDAWLELWATGPLNLRVLHFGALARVRGSCFTQPSPFSAPVRLSIDSHLLDTTEELSSALWKGKKQKRKKSETVFFQALNSMALAFLSSHDTTLLASSLFLAFSLNLFFRVFFLLQSSFSYGLIFSQLTSSHRLLPFLLNITEVDIEPTKKSK